MVVRGPFFRLLGILPKITDVTNGEMCITFRGVWWTLNKKYKKLKSGVFSKARGGAEGTIFRLLVILPKITDGTNDEMFIHFIGVWCTLNKKEKEKKEEFFQRLGVLVGGPFSDF